MLDQDLGELARLLKTRSEAAPVPSLREEAGRLHNHLVSYLIPRADDLSAPLLVVLLGSTGSGKSTIFNSLAGKPLSPSGLLRPTTRKPVALIHPDDAIDTEHLELVRDPAAPKGLVLVDSPDFDSVELANRDLALDLLEEADLVIFVTTVTRYADQVPWQVLERARQRGVPLLTVINRLPEDEKEQADVIADYRSLLGSRQLLDSGAFGALEVVAVPEGAIDRDGDSISGSHLASIHQAIARLRDDDAARRQVARSSLVTALRGLPEAIGSVALAVQREEEASVRLLGVAGENYRRGRALLEAEIESGNFLRGEVLTQWLDFVRAGPTARFLAEGIGKIAASLRNLFRTEAPGPTPPVRETAMSDLSASARRHLDNAARRTATEWTEDTEGARALSDHPELWSGGADFDPTLKTGLDDWAEGIASEITELGAQRKVWAQAASIGLNVLGTSAMVAVFLHTGGLTGAEVGIGAATAVVNQKLLETIFGEANVAAFVKNARARLEQVIAGAFHQDLARFEGALPTPPAGTAVDLRRLARSAAEQANSI